MCVQGGAGDWSPWLGPVKPADWHQYADWGLVTPALKDMKKCEEEPLPNRIEQGCPTFHLPWATLEDENFVWATHLFIYLFICLFVYLFIYLFIYLIYIPPI